MKKALITEEFHPLLMENLIAMGYQCDEVLDIDTEGVAERISGYELIVVNSKIKLDKDLLAKATKMKAIVRIGSGLEVIDVEECQKKGIRVISTPEGNANAVAEHVLGFILSAFHNIYKSQNDILRGNWIREENRGIELSGKTMGIIGCGNNGSRLVNILSGWDVNILIYDIVDITPNIQNANARQVSSMKDIYEKADIVSFHVPLTQDTKYMISSHYLHSFHKNIYFVNASRGQICQMETIYGALESGKIIKAMIDVFDNEPFISNEETKKWVESNRLFLTPHIAGWTAESKKKMAEWAVLKLNSH